MAAGIINIDVHGMNLYQARIKIDSTLRRADKGVYRIRIVHGYNDGTAIKEMIAEEYANHPKIKRIVYGTNQGQTELLLREF